MALSVGLIGVMALGITGLLIIAAREKSSDEPDSPPDANAGSSKASVNEQFQKVA